jgi:hypothetical protein
MNKTVNLRATLQEVAQDCGWSVPPFRWDQKHGLRFHRRQSAALSHLYLPAEADRYRHLADGETEEDLTRLKTSFPTPRGAVAYIMDTFPIVKRKDETKWDTYRNKDIILEIYDAMAESIRTGRPYQTRLAPPPADPRCCHPPRETGRV